MESEDKIRSLEEERRLLDEELKNELVREEDDDKSPHEEDPSLSFELVEMYQEEEETLIKLFMNNLPLTLKEDEKYQVILNTFFLLEEEVLKFHKDLETRLVEVLVKREKKIYPLTSHKSTASVMRQFSILYFLLQKPDIVKKVIRRTKLETLDYLRRHLEKSHILDIIYAFFRTKVKFEQADKSLTGKMFKEDSHKRYGKCEGFVIVHALSPALFESKEGDLIKESIVITKPSTRGGGRGHGRMNMMMKGKRPGGRGGGLMGLQRGNNPRLMKAETSFALGGAKLVETEKTRRMEVKRRESAVAVKEEKIKRKVEKLRQLEEDLKRKEEALSLFEKELNSSVLPTAGPKPEEQKRLMLQKVRELEARKAERVKRRKDRIRKKIQMDDDSSMSHTIRKKKTLLQAPKKASMISQSVAVTKRDVSHFRKKNLNLQTEESRVEEEEQSCPKPVDEIVQEFMETSMKFSGISRNHFSKAEEHVSRNRSRDVLPYNHNYVSVGKKKHGYLNASECRVNDVSYFAAQWPLVDNEVDCVDDYWDMVYTHKCKVIVSLQKPTSPNFKPYWPIHEGEMIVTEHYVIKTVIQDITPMMQEVRVQVMKKKKKKTLGLFKKKKKEEKFLECTLFLYTSWPEDGLPEDFDSLRQVMVKADAILQKKENYVSVKLGRGKEEVREAPMVVHCSVGVGRTGVFLACHNILRKGLGIESIKDTFFKMTKLRNKFIQNELQYGYCYDFVWKYGKK